MLLKPHSNLAKHLSCYCIFVLLAAPVILHGYGFQYWRGPRDEDGVMKGSTSRRLKGGKSKKKSARERCITEIAASPVNPTVAPVRPTTPSVKPSAAPVAPTAAPVNPTAAPVAPTAAPVNPTATPVKPIAPRVPPTTAPVQPTVTTSPVVPVITFSPIGGPTTPMPSSPVFNPTTKPVAPVPPPTTTGPTGGTCPTSCSPGVTALEYLGIGYNIIEGNPRGSPTSELDPGFRQGVIQLVQVQDPARKTLDGAFLVPLGTDLRYDSTCQFQSSSAEVSSSSQLQQQLSKEATQTLTVGFELNLGIFSLGNSEMFTRSEQFNEFSSARSQSQTTTFQSTAVCTEFIASLDMYLTHELQPNFLRGLDTLVPFDPNNNNTVAIYRRFLNEFGTHFVSKVVLGAKQSYSTTFRSSDVAMMQSSGTSISTAMDSKTHFGFDLGKAVPGQDLPAAKDILGNPEAAAAGAVINLISNTNGNAQVGVGTTTAETSRRDMINMLRTMAQQTTESSVGGRPAANGDWRTWAASARQRPMPILYDLTLITTVMNTTVAQWYSDAVVFIYKNGITAPSDFNRAVAFGVVNQDGLAITPYTLDPLSGLRTIVTRLPDPVSGMSRSFMVGLDTPSSFVSAVFVTPVKGSIAPNAKEENSVSSSPGSPFASNVTASRVVVTVPLDGTQRDSFSFLTVNNLVFPGIVSGVVHPDGFILNEIFPNEPLFEISQAEDLSYILNFSKNFTASPTMIALPIVFAPNDGLSQISTVSTSCTPASCTVQLGSTQNVGFSFLALDGALVVNPNAINNIAIVHGTVTYSSLTNDIVFSGPGFNATSQFTNTGGIGSVFVGGVQIVFDTPFEAIPAVIATHFSPNNGFDPALSLLSLDIAVEHITRKDAFIKPFLIHLAAEFFPTSFHFVVIGPRK